MADIVNTVINRAVAEQVRPMAEQARQQVEREFARSEATKDFLVRSLDLAGLHQSGRRLSVRRAPTDAAG